MISRNFPPSRVNLSVRFDAAIGQWLSSVQVIFALYSISTGRLSRSTSPAGLTSPVSTQISRFSIQARCLGRRNDVGRHQRPKYEKGGEHRAGRRELGLRALCQIEPGQLKMHPARRFSQ